jgi:transposase
MQAARAVRGAASQMALSHAERDELMKLRKENKALRTERDILSKATA